MALHWNVSNVADHEERCYYDAPEAAPMQGIAKGDRILRPETHALVMASLSVGLGSISEKNWAKWYARLHTVEKLYGTHLRDNGKPVYLTPEDVRAHIGLSTNVSRETDAQWRKRMLQGTVDQYERDATRAYERAQKAAS